MHDWNNEMSLQKNVKKMDITDMVIVDLNEVFTARASKFSEGVSGHLVTLRSSLVVAAAVVPNMW